ncbi:hypothetical protein JY651_44585 [Pyxidicoccus parkwayensis]|uniref:Outer membrane protein beta-barrel domain-containing protein n=1 Tax=Pyxidicoccus parkwayensis TaxID=2813578 RepID=A0ABX7NTB8_9BACT|nr:hypothetical protein [Pyxidicoccus parkwaysis]QSQ22140.1 hypothetical protein JY651_44585 [Pyxidicoccus parkwaysis]
MRKLSKWVALAGVLCVGTEAMADGWRGYASLGAGVALDHLSGFHAKGATLHGYLGVEAPMGLSLGFLAEGAEMWGGDKQPVADDPSRLERSQFDYKAAGIEARVRFFRDKTLNPWIGARLSKSWSNPFTADDFGQLRRKKFETMSMAIRGGVDGWFNERWGLSVATAIQFCDMKFPEDIKDVCFKPIQSVIAGPVLRF